MAFPSFGCGGWRLGNVSAGSRIPSRSEENLARFKRALVTATPLLFALFLVPRDLRGQDSNYCAECEVDGCIPGYDLISSQPAGAYFWPYGSVCSSRGCPTTSAHCHTGTDEADAAAATLASLVFRAVDLDNDRALSALLLWIPSRVRFNELRRAVQILSCDEKNVVAHIPVSGVLAFELAAFERVNAKGPIEHSDP